MKKLCLIIIGIMIGSQTMAQTTTQDSFRQISYISPKRDTLMLPSTSDGFLVQSMWKDVKEKKRPIIIITTEAIITEMNKRDEE